MYEIDHRDSETGLTLYMVRKLGDKVWNGSSLVPFVAADWAGYVAPLPETPAGSRHYMGGMEGLPAGHWKLWVFSRPADQDPSISDLEVGVGEIDWSGSAEIRPPSLATLTALLALPRTGHTLTEGEKIIVARGDRRDVPFSLGPAHDCRGKRLFFCVKRLVEDVASIIDVECVLSDELNVIGSVPLTPQMLATALTGKYEYERRDADGTSNPYTISQGTFRIVPDLRR